MALLKERNGFKVPFFIMGICFMGGEDRIRNKELSSFTPTHNALHKSQFPANQSVKCYCAGKKHKFVALSSLWLHWFWIYSKFQA